MRSAGYPAEIVRKDNYFAVQVPRLAGEQEARSLMAAIRATDGVELPTLHEGN